MKIWPRRKKGDKAEKRSGKIEIKSAQSTAKLELLTYAFAEDNAAHTIALLASFFAFLQ